MSNGLKTFNKINGYNYNDDAAVNYQGGRAYEMDLKEKIRSMARLGIIHNTYYENQKLIIQRSMDTLKKATETIPQYVMDEAIEGRKTYQMKFMPVLFLVYLSTIKDSTFFFTAFDKVILTAKDLHVFLELCRKGGIRKGISRKIRKAINTWLENHMSEKLATRNKNTLMQVVNCSRPNPETASKNQELLTKALRYVAKGELTLDRAVALKSVIETMQSGKLTSDVLENIKKYRLELEELKSVVGFLSPEDKKTLYEFFIPNFRYAGLCSNLVNIERAFNREVPENITDMVFNMLMSIKDYKESKMLPFGLITARKMTRVSKWQSALDYVLANAIDSSFNLKDHILVAVDTSDSMSWDENKVGHATSAELASTFGAVMKLSNKNKVDLCAVASVCKNVEISGENVFDVAIDISNTYVGGGTKFEQIFQVYNGQKVIILITDSEQADNFEYKWRKANKPEESIVIVWQIAGYPHKISNRSDTIYLYGYSLTMLNSIKALLEEHC